jgi:hypothetical protein
MYLPIKVKSPNNISKWQMGFNSAFTGLKFNTKKFDIVITWNLCALHGSLVGTANFGLQNIKISVFMTEVESVYSAVRTEYLYNTDTFHL